MIKIRIIEYYPGQLIEFYSIKITKICKWLKIYRVLNFIN